LIPTIWPAKTWLKVILRVLPPIGAAPYCRAAAAQWHWADDARSGTDERCDQSRLSHYRIAGSERQYGSIKHHRWLTTSYQPE